MKKYVPFILLTCILLTSLLLRVYALQSVPVGMTDDEVRLAYSAYSLWHTGRDVSQGLLLPFSFVLHNFSFAPVSVYITAPFVGLFGLSPFTARLPFALAGAGVVLLTYLLVLRLLRAQGVALVAASVLAVNAWALQLSRISYESGFALFFYLAGAYAFLGDWKKRIFPVIVAMALLFLGFHSYNATKLVYVPLVIALTWYKWKEIRLFRPFVTGILISICFTLISFWYFSVVQGAGAHGGNIFVFQNTAAAAEAVELARRGSWAPPILAAVYHNKLTYFTDIVVHHYMYAFSPEFLFLNQEGSGIYSLWSRGNFYLLELPFLIFGLVALWAGRRRICILIIAFLLLSAIPSGVGPEPFTYATRSSFMLPWIALLIAAGLSAFVASIKKTFWRFTAITVIAACYVFSVGGYLTQYYFEWPRYSAKSFAKDQKDIVSFIEHYPDREKKFVITNVSDMFFLQYVFHTRADPRMIQELYKGSGKPDEFGRLRIMPSCAPAIPEGVIYISSRSCHREEPDGTISLPDGQKMWNIYLKVPADENLPKE